MRGKDNEEKGERRIRREESREIRARPGERKKFGRSHNLQLKL